jgi:hypothetical protein
MAYFWTPKHIGLKADIARHTKEQKELELKIKELEELEVPNSFQVIALRTYRNLLNKLMQSKAELVSKIGK